MVVECSSCLLRPTLASGHLTNLIMNTSEIAILMCTYNGERFLGDQLSSFIKQRHANWKLWISDDGSTDGTLAILEKFAMLYPNRVASIFRGPSQDHAANFLSLVSRAEIQADYFAFSDQDDIWHDDKLERALNILDVENVDNPLLYCGRTRIVDEQNQEMALSRLFSRKPSFANALVQSIGGGNTMVFNNRTRELLRIAGPNLAVTHDWWAYIVVSGCGGFVFYDREPSLRYRQHSSNVIGVNSSWSGRIARFRMLLNGRFRDWNDANIEALQPLLDYLTPANRRMLQEFQSARDESLIRRLLKLKKCGIYRQTLFGNLSLLGAAILRKI